jgi:hypothetical protein
LRCSLLTPVLERIDGVVRYCTHALPPAVIFF